ncbi:hypothetical protein [Billgrantia diversa]|nr:hypothetical protein [Halomonas sp. MCCC 1A13316]
MGASRAMPTITLTRRDVDQHRYVVTDRDAFTCVKAYKEAEWAEF